MDINPTPFAKPTSFIDNLSKVTQEDSASNKLKIIHKEIKQHMPFVERIAVIVYEEERDLLKTLIHSDDNKEKVLQFYQSNLSGSESLSKIAHSGTPRIVNDQGIFEPFNLNQIMMGDFVEVRGFLDGSTVVAVELEREDDPDPGDFRTLLRGPVTAFDGASSRNIR